MEKAPELIEAVSAIRRRIGDTMVVVDHWESDLMAVGIAREGSEQRLAYISVRPSPNGSRYYVALENPPRLGSATPDENAGERGDLSLAEAAEVIAGHLGVPW
jgi:hypothetical protein